MTRPTRQPCSSPTGEASVAPAPRARATIVSGSSTTRRVLLVLPPTAKGLKRPALELAGATQKRASPTSQLGYDIVAFADAVKGDGAEGRFIKRDGRACPLDP